MKTYSWNKYTEGDAVRLNVETRLWTAAVTLRKALRRKLWTFCCFVSCFSLTARENFPNVVDFNISVLFVTADTCL